MCAVLLHLCWVSSAPGRALLGLAAAHQSRPAGVPTMVPETVCGQLRAARWARLRALWQVLQMSSPWKMTPCCRRRCLRKAPAALMLRGPLGGSIRHYLEQPCGSGCERERAPKQRFRGLGFSSFRRSFSNMGLFLHGIWSLLYIPNPLRRDIAVWVFSGTTPNANPLCPTTVRIYTSRFS